MWFMLLGYAVLCVLWLIAAKKGYLSRRTEKLLLILLYVLVWVGAGVMIVVAVRECPVQTEISHEQVNSQTGTLVCHQLQLVANKRLAVRSRSLHAKSPDVLIERPILIRNVERLVISVW